jgi:hypothetical protein
VTEIKTSTGICQKSFHFQSLLVFGIVLDWNDHLKDLEYGTDEDGRKVFQVEDWGVILLLSLFLKVAVGSGFELDSQPSPNVDIHAHNHATTLGPLSSL